MLRRRAGRTASTCTVHYIAGLIKVYLVPYRSSGSSQRTAGRAASGGGDALRGSTRLPAPKAALLDYWAVNLMADG